jgi:hypothetical protein
LLKRKETLLKAALTYNELACRWRQEAISIRFRLEGAEAYEVPLIGLANAMQIVPGSELTYVDLISQYVQSRNFEKVYSASDALKLGCLRPEDVGVPSLLERSALQIADDPASRLELEKFMKDAGESPRSSVVG